MCCAGDEISKIKIKNILFICKSEDRQLFARTYIFATFTFSYPSARGGDEIVIQASKGRLIYAKINRQYRKVYFAL